MPLKSTSLHQPKRITLAEMEIGQLGILKEPDNAACGHIIYKVTQALAVDINSPMYSWTNNMAFFHVELIPKGTKLEFEVV